MKTFARLIRRYVFAAVGLGLLLPALCIGLLVWLGWQTFLREFLSCFSLIFRAFPAFCFSVIRCADHKNCPDSL